VHEVHPLTPDLTARPITPKNWGTGGGMRRPGLGFQDRKRVG